MEGLVWWASAAGKLAIFGDMGMSGVGVIGDFMSLRDIGGIVLNCLVLRNGFGDVGWVIAWV